MDASYAPSPSLRVRRPMGDNKRVWQIDQFSQGVELAQKTLSIVILWADGDGWCWSHGQFDHAFLPRTQAVGCAVVGETCKCVSDLSTWAHRNHGYQRDVRAIRTRWRGGARSGEK